MTLVAALTVIRGIAPLSRRLTGSRVTEGTELSALRMLCGVFSAANSWLNAAFWERSRQALKITTPPTSTSRTSEAIANRMRGLFDRKKLVRNWNGLFFPIGTGFADSAAFSKAFVSLTFLCWRGVER